MKPLGLIDRRANAELDPLVKLVAKTPGGVSRVAEFLSNVTGVTQYRANVRKWLHPDPRKRRQPVFGVGLLLVDMCESARFQELMGLGKPPRKD